MERYRSALGVNAIAALFSSSPAIAGEGGGSNYLQSTCGDFQSDIFRPTGLYYRNDLFYYEAGLLGGRVNAGVDQKVWANLSKISCTTNSKTPGRDVPDPRIAYAWRSTPCQISRTLAVPWSAPPIRQSRSSARSNMS